MASEIVKDIDEKFCQCCICLEQFKEPKLLPCLHRFCKDCLADMIKPNRGSLPCPVCREECVVPKEGLEGFKTDFYMKNIIEYIQLKTSAEDERTQECYSCSQVFKVSAYCFKCNGFLCEPCHQFHVTSKVTKDHRPHTLALEDIASKQLSLDKLASLKAAPRCYTHSEKLSELCCQTCGNIPICLACTYGSHKGHDCHEVTTLANEERQKLKEELAELCSMEERIFQMPEKLVSIESEIKATASERIKYLQTKFADKSRIIENELQTLRNKSNSVKIQEEKALKEELDLIQSDMEKEMEKVKLKYHKICEEKEAKSLAKLDISESHLKEQSSNLHKRLTDLDISCKTSTASVRKQQKDNIKKLQEISAHYEGTIERYKNLKAMASSILKSMDDWTTVQCIRDISAASAPLMEEMKREYPELLTLNKIQIQAALLSDSVDEYAHLTNQESEVSIEEIRNEGWSICDMKTTPEGDIVISGNASATSCYIGLINMKGQLTLHKTMEPSCHWFDPECYFDYLPISNIFTSCDADEIGICNLRFEEHVRKNVSKTIPGWRQTRGVTCVAADIANEQIFVGDFEERDVLVFSYHLDFLRVLRLPDQLIGCHGITVHGNNVVVCDSKGRKAVTMNLNGKIVYEFMKPFNDDNDWKPIKVCADSRGSVYILWCSGYAYSGEHVITQNSQDGATVLTVLRVDDDAFAITTMKTNDKERLLVTTLSTGKLFTYNLVP